MLMPRPEAPRFTEKINRLELTRLSFLERWPKIRRNLARTGLTLNLLAGIYTADVAIHETMQRMNDIDIDMLGQPLDNANNHSAIVFLDGWGKKDAQFLTTELGPAFQGLADGELWSVNYNDAKLTTTRITDEIIDLAEERGIDHLSFVGYSTGGILATETADDVVSSSDLDVQLIADIVTPNGTAGLQPDHQSEMSGLMGLIASVPGSEYSSITNALLDMHFGDSSSQTPAPWLITDQSLAIANADMQQHIAHIAKKTKSGEQPVTLYLGGNDQMVNGVKSSKEICQYVGQAGMQCFSALVPGEVHGLITRSTYDPVIEAVRAEVQAAIANEETKKSVKTYELLDLLPTNGN